MFIIPNQNINKNKDDTFAYFVADWLLILFCEYFAFDRSILSKSSTTGFRDQDGMPAAVGIDRGIFLYIEAVQLLAGIGFL